MNIRQARYKVQDKLFPRGSKRRKLIQFIYRLPKKLTMQNIKKGFKVLKNEGIKLFFIRVYKFIIYRPTHGEFHIAYMGWIKNNEPNEEEIKTQIKHKFEFNPKISIIVPMYNTPENFFVDLVNCLKNQTYTNWELCLADGSEEKADYLESILLTDDRIKYKFLNSNKGISENSNAGLKMATGDYMALLDHDDILPIFALYEIIKVINENRDVEFIYTDEDKFIYSNDDRYDPHFKPDYSPDLLRSYNYITHLSIFKKELMDKLEGFKNEYNGAQDYDIILRATELTNKIIHIPKILYHWRVHPNSTAFNSNSKLYAYDAGRDAISDHLKRKNIKATVANDFSLGLYKVKYEIIGNPLISILIPNKDSVNDLKTCINSIQKSKYTNYEIIVIENNSEDEKTFKFYEEITKKNKNIKIVEYKEKGFNYSKINNYGAKYANGDYLLLLNNDIEVITKDWLEEMLSICQREDVGIVGAKLLYHDNTVQHAGVVIGMGGIAGHINKLISDKDIGYYARAEVINNYSAVTAACMLVKKDLFEKVNGLSEEFKVAFNDIDFCLKIRQLNKLIVYTPYARLYHFESKTRGYEDTPEKQERFKGEIDLFREKWNEVLESGDPYFNKNFRLDMPIYYINGKEKIN